MLHRFKKLGKDIHCDEFEESSYGKELKFTHMTLCRMIPWATLAFADYALKICSHLRPLKLAS